MRRIVFLLLGLVLAACGETVVSGDEMALASEAAVDAGPDADLELDSTVEESDTDVSATTTPTTTTATAVVLPTGREALAAAQAEGRPVVLWFWGAH
jgi:hypothetical protein